MAGGLPKRFGLHIREMRLARDLTQQALADRSGLSVDAVRRIERGALSPSLGTVEKLAHGLRISLHTLFRRFETEDPDEVAEVCDYLGHLDTTQLQTAWRVIQAMFSESQQGPA